MWIFSTHSTHEKTPQNNFSRQNFIIENNYFCTKMLTRKVDLWVFFHDEWKRVKKVGKSTSVINFKKYNLKTYPLGDLFLSILYFKFRIIVKGCLLNRLFHCLFWFSDFSQSRSRKTTKSYGGIFVKETPNLSLHKERRLFDTKYVTVDFLIFGNNNLALFSKMVTYIFPEKKWFLPGFIWQHLLGVHLIWNICPFS